MQKFVIADDISITPDNIADWIQQFTSTIQPHLVLLDTFFEGVDDLKKVRTGSAIDNKVHINLASMLVNNATSYVIGKPVTYSYKDDFKQNEFIKKAQINNNEDIENEALATDCSKYGIGYELINIRVVQGKKQEYYKRLNPLQTLAVLDNTIFRDKVCVITLIPSQKDKNTLMTGYIYTSNEIIPFNYQSNQVTFGESQPTNTDDLPVVVWQNSLDYKGDYEAVLEPLNQYSKLYSGGLDDFESIANAILAFYNTQELDECEKTKLNKSRVLRLLGEGAKVEYIYKKLDANYIDKLRTFLREDILSITNIPDFTDKNFAGNQAGVALSYKLLGFENLRKRKETYYKQAIIERWQLISQLPLNPFNIEIDDITLQFYPNIPENVAQDLEYVQMWEEGAISTETMLSKLETVDDVEEELKRLKAEKKERLEIVQNEELPKLNV